MPKVRLAPMCVLISVLAILGILFFLFRATSGQAVANPPAVRIVHVFVALADNENQGIIPVPESLGNGEDQARNLYWGAMYGVKSYFRRSGDWIPIPVAVAEEEDILERRLFKHRDKDVILLKCLKRP